MADQAREYVNLEARIREDAYNQLIDHTERAVAEFVTRMVQEYPFINHAELSEVLRPFAEQHVVRRYRADAEDRKVVSVARKMSGYVPKDRAPEASASFSSDEESEDDLTPRIRARKLR